FVSDTATTVISTLSLHDALPICDPFNTVLSVKRLMGRGIADVHQLGEQLPYRFVAGDSHMPFIETVQGAKSPVEVSAEILKALRDRKSTRLNSSHVKISYAVFCL